MKLYAANGLPYYIDEEDYECVKKYRWCRNKSGYLSAHIKGSTRKIVMHRLIMNFPQDCVVDHINGCRYDNRRCNLRFANRAQNSMNSIKRSDNSSGCTGVSWDKSRGKWIVLIASYGKRKNLGRFDSFDDAVNARLQAEKETFGEFSYIYRENVPLPKEETEEV